MANWDDDQMHRNELAETKFMRGDEMAENNFRIYFVCMTAKFALGPVLPIFTFRPTMYN
jgi:hypothetical protein